jgi:hypothetical protein
MMRQSMPAKVAQGIINHYAVLQLNHTPHVCLLLFPGPEGLVGTLCKRSASGKRLYTMNSFERGGGTAKRRWNILVTYLYVYAFATTAFVCYPGT